jgi:hypothetical protein
MGDGLEQEVAPGHQAVHLVLLLKDQAQAGLEQLRVLVGPTTCMEGRRNSTFKHSCMLVGRNTD